MVNCATDKCKTKQGSYGDDVDVLVVEGLLDDPDARKKVDAMPDGDEKEAARKALPEFPAQECAGNVKKDFERVNDFIDAAKAADGAAAVHCYASLSRSAAFIMAYMMKKDRMTVVEAAKEMRKTWDATWPNDSFVEQLIEYEKELGIPVHMRVTTKKSVGFYTKTAKNFLQGVEDKDGTKKEPVEEMIVSGLGEAGSTAAAVASNIEAEGIGKISKIETSYPTMGGGGSCAKIEITVLRK